MALYPARLPVAVTLDAFGNGTIQQQPFAAFWSTLTITLKAATLSSPVYDVSLGTDPVLFASGQRAELGPFICAPQDSVTITITNGAPGDVVQGTLWGVRADTDVEAATALQGIMANGYTPPTRLRTYQGVVAIAGGAATFSVPIPSSAVGVIVVPSSGLAPQITAMSAVSDATATALPVYQSGGMWCFDVEAGAGQSGSIGTPTYDANAVVTISAPGAGIGPWRVTAFAVFPGGMPPRPFASTPVGARLLGFDISIAAGQTGLLVAAAAGKTIRIYNVVWHLSSGATGGVASNDLNVRFEDTSGALVDCIRADVNGTGPGVSYSPVHAWGGGEALAPGLGLQFHNVGNLILDILGKISYTQS